MDSIKDLLSDPLKGSKHAAGVLCYLFREVLLWRGNNNGKGRGVNQFTWNKLSRNYFAKPHNQINPDKGNLHKALKADDMPWNGFKTAVDFLSPVEATLEVKLNWIDHSQSTYVVNVDPLEDELHPVTNNFPWQHCELFSDRKPSTTLMSHLFRHIVATEGAKHEDIKLWWAKLFEDYATNPVNVVGLPQKEINTNANNLKRSLLDPNMSWNTFRRGIYLMHPRSEEYTLTMRWTDDPIALKSFPDTVVNAVIVDPYFVE